MKGFYIILSILALAACIVMPALFFLGQADDAAYKSVLLAASMVYFVAATLWAGQRDGRG